MKKQIKLSSILLWTTLSLSPIHFAFLMLGLFGIITPACLERNTFNYIVSFVLVAVCLSLYIVFMIIEKKNKLIFPEWFKNMLYIGLYIFTNIYYYFGLYQNIIGLIVFYAYLGVLFNIISLAIFFNTQKSADNSVKASNTFVSITTFAYSLTFGVMLEIIVATLKLIFIKNTKYATLSVFIIEMCVVVLVSVVMAIIFYRSLSRKKQVINNCLIKYYNEKQ